MIADGALLWCEDQGWRNMPVAYHGGGEPMSGESSGKRPRRFSLKDEDIVARKVSRRSALALLGAAAPLGAASVLLGGCAYGGDGGGYGGGGGGYPERHHDIKLGDGNDYTVYADGRDLDADARDTSDHAHTRTADRSSSNDYD